MNNSILKKANGTAAMPQSSRSLTNVFDQFFQNNLNRFFNDDLWGFTGLEGQANIPVNLKETDKTYELQLVAPGLKKEDFKLNVSNQQLMVSFEQRDQQQQENQEDGWLRKEFRMQSFNRSFNLDDTVDVNKITAAYTDGILQLTLPKKETAQRISKQIEIK